MNKKLFLFAVLLFAGALAFCQKYRIQSVSYAVTGCGWKICPPTTEYNIARKIRINYSKVFETSQDLETYVQKYEQQLYNLRQFALIDIKIHGDTFDQDIDYYYEDENRVIPVNLEVTLADSFHFVAIPFFKYNSNTGSVFQLKLVDTNFLGTLNKLDSDLFFQIKPEDDGSKSNIIGANIKYDYPFKAGIFDASWTNLHTFSYTFGNSSPEFNLRTGIKLELPKDNYSFEWEAAHSFVKNLEYQKFDDSFYMQEFAQFAVPVHIYELDAFNFINYKPYINFTYNWDFDGINAMNAEILSPALEIGHSIYADNFDWFNQFRNGYSFELTNGYNYNFERQLLNPYIKLDTKLFKAYENIGFTSNFLYFISFIQKDNQFFCYDGFKIGERLRGVKDTMEYNAGAYKGNCALIEYSAIVLNLDMPIKLFRTKFADGIMEKLNFELQFAPFIDIALTYNKFTGEWYNPKDGFYCAGFEVLVYPVKWKSFVVRGSLGIDIGSTLLKNQLNTQWRESVSKYEISFGIGLMY